MSTSDVLKTYQNITSGLQHQILLIYYTLNKTLPPNTVLSLNWSFRKLEVEMVQYANDILEKRKCSETLRIASLVIWPTALMIKILSFRVNFFFCSKSNKLGYAINICSFFYPNYHLFFIFIYFYSRGLMARNILIHEDGTAKVGLLTSYNTSTYKNMSISGVVGFSFFSPLFCRIVNCQLSFS